ncbi:DUF2271 domain-containing protein [Shewanella sp. Scap07]|uniref:DUF2271 domain-containing protein n=1 Tax=Shewanella sp. Scap07 TaxID=2589987 RepID=UPI0015BA7A1A|nr:DUF2271 domain-containing protein [Shewanella sp. Scap07]QLE85475.1 DUF2271 domain-containing protein [Shewanella sp. Scap07]
MNKTLLGALLCTSMLAMPVSASKIEIDLGLAEITEGQYLRPYTAVWVEDSRGKHVDTIALWTWDEGEKWLKDIRRWWRKIGRDEAGFIDGVTGATRPSGQYKLDWDFTDSEGKSVAAGKYTLLVEVVREHGNRSLVRHKFNHDGKAFAVTLPPTDETAEITIKYQP